MTIILNSKKSYNIRKLHSSEEKDKREQDERETMKEIYRNDFKTVNYI